MEQFCKTVVPSFLTKLWMLVDNADLDHVIRWSKDGQSFQIVNKEAFSEVVLPKHFKHNKMASFIRQLNMYGFRKVISQQTEKTSEEKKVSMAFQHPFFKKGGSRLLGNIKRKVPKIEDANLYCDEFQKVVTEMQEFKDKQNNMEILYAQMKQDYSDLCIEVTNLRKKYSEQQQLLTQVLHFILDSMTRNHTALKKRKRSLPFITGASDSERDHQDFHIPEEMQKEAMEILKDGYEFVEDKYKNLLDRVSPIWKNFKKLISSVDQPSGDDGKHPNASVQDIPMNDHSLTFPLELTMPSLQDQIIEEASEQEPNNISSELVHSSQDSILINNESDILCNSIINSDKMNTQQTDENLVELNSLLSVKTVNYDFDHLSEGLSLMRNEEERSLLDTNGEKDEQVMQCKENSQLSLLDETPVFDFGENLQDSNNTLLDDLNNPSNVLPTLYDPEFVTLDISAIQEDTANTIENAVPQFCMEGSGESDVSPFLYFDPASNMF